jgi:hypothetical protein
MLIAGPASGAVAIRADPTDSPSPTPGATEYPELPCASVQSPPNDNSVNAYGPGQGLVAAIPFTNTAGAAIGHARFQAFVVDDSKRAGAPPDVMWSLDGGAWQPLGHLSVTPAPPGGYSLPQWQSGNLSIGTLEPHTTHSLRFWVHFGPGVLHSSYAIEALVDWATCPGQPLGGDVVADYYPSTPAATATAPKPTPAVVAPSPTPTTTVSSTPVSARPVAAYASDSWSLPRVGALGLGVVLVGLGLRMAMGWWLARRRVSP